jgi:polyphosphate glucokinase
LRGKKFAQRVNSEADKPGPHFSYGQIKKCLRANNHFSLPPNPENPADGKTIMNVLVIDIGGTHVKVLATGQSSEREFVSGRDLTPKKMVSGVRKVVGEWDYDVVSVGYPGLVSQNRPVCDPWNLGKGWAGFNFEAAFRCPVKVVNDAAMQALGSYKGGKMLFLGLGTGLGSTLIVDGIIEPMELGHLPYKKATFEDYVGVRGLLKYGKQKWRPYVADVIKRLITALEPEDVVLGGGNIHKLKKLPPGCRAGDNANAFLGGFRLWQGAPGRTFAHARPHGRAHPESRNKMNKKYA